MIAHTTHTTYDMHVHSRITIDKTYDKTTLRLIPHTHTFTTKQTTWISLE